MVTALIAVFFTISLLPSDTGRSDRGNVLRVGAGDDTSGLLLDQIGKIGRDSGSKTEIVYNDLNMEGYKFLDC